MVVALGLLERYLELTAKGDALAENEMALPEVRIAVLGDHATQRLCNCLRGGLQEKGFFPRIYEGAYDSVALEVRGEELAQFAPQFAYLAISVQKAREDFFALPAEGRLEFPRKFMDTVGEQVGCLQRLGCSVLINTLALPQERMFGNYSQKTPASFLAAVLEVNSQIVQLAQKQGVLLVDVMYTSAVVGSNSFFDERYWILSRSMCRTEYIPLVTDSVLAVLGAALGRITKCIVLDLDNTLWGGVVGDDGVDGVCLGATGPGEVFFRFQQYILAMRGRGYLLAVCSKNEDAAARAPFREHPDMVLKEDDVSVFLANWEPKAENVREIASALNLGLESLVVLDDSPFEREQIRGELPQVVIPELPEDVSEWIGFLEFQGLFEAVSVTSTDADRSRLYAQEALRKSESAKFESLDDYLRSLGMELTIKGIVSQDLDRYCQLLVRTNQFNLRTQRLQPAACREFLSLPNQFSLLGIWLTDRFGDYGMVGAMCVEWYEDSAFLLEFVLSCRVFKRGVEYAALTSVSELAQAKGVKTIRAEYLPSPKNQLVSELYASAGYQLAVQDSSGRRQYTLDVQNRQSNAFPGEVYFDP